MRYNQNLQDIVSEFKTNTVSGLSLKQVEENRKIYGENKLKEKKKKSLFIKFLSQFKDLMVIILIVAAIVSFGIAIYENVKNNWNEKKEFIEPIVILFTIIINAVLGTLQESKAEKALEALKKMSSPYVKVLRDNRVNMIKTEELVPGDIIFLESGDIVPADCRLIDSISLRCDESSLTGESLPVDKDYNCILDKNTSLGDRKNQVFSSSFVSYGRAKAIVTETGMKTEIGKIAKMLNDEKESLTPLQLRLVKLGKVLAIMASIICMIVFILGTIFGQEKTLVEKIMNSFMVAVSLAVAAIPEGLPAIITILLANGVSKMAKKNCIVRKLPAVETLGSASVICSDKTGTLTQNKMTVVEVIKTDNYSENDIVNYATLCCDATYEKDENNEIISTGDPTEICIVEKSFKNGFLKTSLDKAHKRKYEIPFDSERKLMSVICDFNGENRVILKGAFDSFKDISSNSKKEIEDIEKKVNQMAENALRVICVGEKIIDSIPVKENDTSIEKNINIIGLIGMIDPPREEVKEAVSICLQAGIKPIMITGDHIVTAKKIAQDLGIFKQGDLAIEGKVLQKMSEEDLDKKIKEISVFARVSPEDKIRIVKAWKKQDQVVVMTGDGVNDAPALKVADIGCAMGITGTEVSKSAAQMTLTDDNFTTIVHAIKEGRNIYRNIIKSIEFLLSCNIGEVLTVFVAMLVWKTSPLLAMQLLWVNLLTDSFPALALGIDNASNDLMFEKPRKKKETVFSNGVGLNIAVLGCFFGFITLCAFSIGYYLMPDINGNLGTNLDGGRTLAFFVLSTSQLFHSFNIKVKNKTIFSKKTFNNKYLLLAFVISSLILIMTIYVPGLNTILRLQVLPIKFFIIAFLLSFSPILFNEIYKLILKGVKNAKKRI